MYPNPTDYNRDITIIGELPDNDLYGLHKYCHCFLSPSHGEAWSLPAFDAMVFGNTPICSDFGGPREFIDRNNAQTGTLVGGCYKSCRCSDSAFPDMFTGREFWFDPDEMQIRAAMRRYFEAAKSDPAAAKRSNQMHCLGIAQKFDYDAIGELMKGKLNE
jgi:glycosyltransferase involved in cell wall biosynthesis